MENSRNKQIVSFELCTILSSMRKYISSILLCSAHDENQPFVQRIQAVYTTHPLVTQLLQDYQTAHRCPLGLYSGNPSFT